MSTGTALWKGDTWRTAWAELSLSSEGRLDIRTSSGAASIRPRLGRSAFIDTYATDRWLCAVGASGEDVVIGSADGPRLEIIGSIQRAESSAATGFDAHAVRMHDRPGHDECLLVWERGLAIVSPLDGLRWVTKHGDGDLRMVRLSESTASLVGLGVSLTVDLEDGVMSINEAGVHFEVDRETVAEWRRSIGK